MVDALRRVRRWMSRRVFCRFCHTRWRVPMVLGLSIIAPPMNGLRRTRRKPSTIRGARTGCRDRTNLRRLARERIPTGAGEVVRSYHSYRTEAFHSLQVVDPQCDFTECLYCRPACHFAVCTGIKNRGRGRGRVTIRQNLEGWSLRVRYEWPRIG